MTLTNSEQAADWRDMENGPERTAAFEKHYAKVFAEAEQIMVILNRCHEAGKLPDSITDEIFLECDGAGEGMRDVIKLPSFELHNFDDKKGLAELKPHERQFLSRAGIPLDYIRDHDRNNVKARVKAIRRKERDKPTRSLVSHLLFRTHCSLPWGKEKKVCGNPLPQHPDGVNGVICDQCADKLEGKERREKEAKVISEWKTMVARENFWEEITLTHSGIRKEAKAQATDNKAKLDAWIEGRWWRRGKGMLLEGATGTLKSHCIAWALRVAMLNGYRGLWITSEDWDNAHGMNLTFKEREAAGILKEKCRTVDVLALDELGLYRRMESAAPLATMLQERMAGNKVTLVSAQGGLAYLKAMMGDWFADTIHWRLEAHAKLD